MRKKFEEGVCTFCSVDRSINQIYWEDSTTLAWEIPEQFARKELEHQFLIVPKRHLRFPWELKKDEWKGYQNALKILSENFNLIGGMLFVRFGDMSYNAGTVPHLHWNLWVPNKTSEVRIPVFKEEKDSEKNEERATEFVLRYEAGEVPE